LLALALVLYLVVRRPQGPADLATPLQNLTQAIGANQTQLTVLTEKVAHVEPVGEGLQSVQLELRSLAERVGTLESGQQTVKADLQTLGTGLTQTSAAAGNLLTATAAIRDELTQARERLAALQAEAHARQVLEQRTAESVRRLEAVIAGTQSKGVAGENILELVFAKLPQEWQVRNFRVGNKAVEFGLRLPNNLILPIDSKWPATSLLEQFACCEDPDEQQRLKGQIESAVLGKAREVKKYIDPNVTVPFGVAAVPDAVYEVCSGIQADVFQQNVVLVAYSMFVPYLLLVFQTVLKTSQNVDLEKLDAHLQTAQAGQSPPGGGGGPLLPCPDHAHQLPRRYEPPPEQDPKWPHQPPVERGTALGRLARAGLRDRRNWRPGPRLALKATAFRLCRQAIVQP
jgi:DNA recombination protein RmuC